jgi:hypothetical protein
MSGTVRALFDGEVLRPEVPIPLQPNTTYLIAIGREVPASAPGSEDEYPLTVIGRLATDMGVTDLSVRHDHYAHGRVEAKPDAK